MTELREVHVDSPPIRMVWVDAESLTPNPDNWRTHSDRQRQAVGDLLDECDWAGVALYNERTDRLIDGHLRTEIAGARGKAVPVIVGSFTDEQERLLLASLDPSSSLAGIDRKKLDTLLVRLSGSTVERVRELAKVVAQACKSKYQKKATKAPAAREKSKQLSEKWSTDAGQVWEIEGQAGTHILYSGDNQHATVEEVFGRPSFDAILTDPPYCSGGFQEAGKAVGSIGTSSDFIPIANDRLSTRGWASLLNRSIKNAPSKYLYCFTDWRMWVHLFDLVEALGYSVRSMIVWDKQTPGMGRGWRCQHELILWGCRETPPFDKHMPGMGNVIQSEPPFDKHMPGMGNVIQSDRTGNVHHTTEKPVDLIFQLLEASPFIHAVYDPFIGSGTTLLAAEQARRVCYGSELDPAILATALERASDAGLEPRLRGAARPLPRSLRDRMASPNGSG